MRNAKVCSITIILVSLCSLINPIRGSAAVDLSKSEPHEMTQDQIQKDTIVALLYPKIGEAVGKYYLKYFRDLPHTAPYDIQIISVDGEKSDPYLVIFDSFKVKVQVSPYLGPHNPVGTDQIAFRIRMTGEVLVQEFDHIESYELPWNLRDSAKGIWPPVK